VVQQHDHRHGYTQRKARSKSQACVSVVQNAAHNKEHDVLDEEKRFSVSNVLVSAHETLAQVLFVNVLKCSPCAPREHGQQTSVQQHVERERKRVAHKSSTDYKHSIKHKRHTE